MEAGNAATLDRALGLLPEQRGTALTAEVPTLQLAPDVEVYGRCKRGVPYIYQTSTKVSGPAGRALATWCRPGRPWARSPARCITAVTGFGQERRQPLADGASSTAHILGSGAHHVLAVLRLRGRGVGSPAPDPNAARRAFRA